MLNNNNSNDKLYNVVNDLVVERINNLIVDEIDVNSWVLANRGENYILFDDDSELEFSCDEVASNCITIYIQVEYMNDEFGEYCQTDSEGRVKNIISLNDY